MTGKSLSTFIIMGAIAALLSGCASFTNNKSSGGRTTATATNSPDENTEQYNTERRLEGPREMFVQFGAGGASRVK